MARTVTAIVKMIDTAPERVMASFRDIITSISLRFTCIEILGALLTSDL